MRRVCCVSRFFGHLIAISFLVLVGCRHYVAPPLEDPAYKMPRRVTGSSDKILTRMVKHFNQGKVVKVISIGQDYLLAVSSSSLFYNNSPRLTWSSYTTLNRVARFLRHFHKVAITVTSFTPRCGSDRREHALALARARQVGDYLWSQGVDSRFIFTQGAGADKPITRFTNKGDASPSSRIEITFRDAIV